MKERLENPRAVGTPGDGRSRVAVAAVAGLSVVGVLLAGCGVVSGETGWLLSGAAVSLLALIAQRWWLRTRAGRADAALADVWAGTPAPDETRAARLLTLLEDWEALEEQRGSANFDPWALQSLRNEIRQVVESDPALAELFTRLRAAA
jgi:hypothetical protein